MADFQAEIESIREAAKGMDNGPIASAQKLVETMKNLKDFTAATDWSEVSSCLGFGTSFAAAIAAYSKVADDLLTDAQQMQTNLNQIADQYATADENSRASLEAAIAGLGSASFMTDDPGSDAFEQHQSELESSNPEQAPDQPDGDTGSSSTTTTPSAPATTGSSQARIE